MTESIVSMSNEASLRDAVRMLTSRMNSLEEQVANMRALLPVAQTPQAMSPSPVNTTVIVNDDQFLALYGDIMREMLAVNSAVRV